MYKFVLTVFDEQTGPIPIYWDPDIKKSDAISIAYKSFIISGSFQGELTETESIVAMPELNSVGFFFFFTIPDESRRGGVFPVSFSLITDIANQLEAYRKAPLISSNLSDLSHIFPKLIEGEELNEEFLKIELERVKQNLTNETKEFSIKKYKIDHDFPVNFQKLLENVTQNLDMAIFAILTGSKIAIAAESKEQVKEILGALITFAPHRRITVEPWVESLDDWPIENPDFVGIPIELSRPLRDNPKTTELVRVNLKRKKVFGGRANRFCQALLKELEQSMVGHEEIATARINWLLQNTSYFGHLTTSDELTQIQNLIKKIDRDTLYLITSILEQNSPMLAETLERKLGRIQLKGLVEI